MPVRDREMICRHIDVLSTNPFPKNSSKLRGLINTYRLKTGQYRVVYICRNREICIEKIGHRKDIYR
ncbi:MAG: type II toxin-antitoxin system RelE/ParE family toxin [Deltaproteobacteria bacterium]|nr:type II toxin-antitoxin system RelE/ParE family toxin [Deltaproteobacteria bacterium]